MDSLKHKHHESASKVAGEQNDLPKDYCTIKINYKSFDYPRDREFTWMMNGHHVSVDSLKEFAVKTYEGLDTIFFNHPTRRKNEFMLCDLTKGQRYEIYYNSCCSDFYFWKEGKSGADKRFVEFQMTGNRKDKKRIGGVSNEAAFLTANKAFSLTGDYMRSPMFPNRYHVFVEEFEPWHEDSTIARIINPVTRKEGKAFKHSNQKLIDFQYVFLDNDSLRVSVDSNDLTVKVERVKSTK
ncbi:MAG: hypothetical protein HOP30_08420 [Cyclobacteriaceae bacterium]|nr:hypothetical protein [Cyclobacteriaceae bacterium]